MSVIAFILPIRLTLGYVISYFLCIAIIFFLRERIAAASYHYEHRYLDYTEILDKAWNNLTLGNNYNEAIWRRRQAEAAEGFYTAAMALQLRKQLGNILLAAASLLPTIFLIGALFYGEQTSAPIVAAIVVNLTRIFLILNSLSALVYKALDLSAMRAKLQVLLAPLSELPDDEADVADLVGTICVNGAPLNGQAQILSYFSDISIGRFRITGANGSGKTSSLLALKERFGAACFLMPVDQTSLAWNALDSAASTGQQMISLLREVVSIDGVTHVLLDEWDANLDQSNTAIIDAVLDEMAKTKVVVEVRHM